MFVLKIFSPEEIRALNCEISGDLRTGVLAYAHKNPFIRKVFWDRLLLEERMFPRGKTALDFGFGHGLFFPTLCMHFPTVFGVDREISGLARAIVKKHCPNVRLIARDGKSTGFKKNFFDLVVASDVLEHFEDLAPPLLEIERILKPGGTLLVSAPTESKVYELGRIFFGAEKPKDHFHKASEIFERLEKKFRLVEKKQVPKGPEFLSLFQVAAFEKRA